MADYDLTQTGQEVQDILDGAAMQTDLTAETERAELAEQTLQGGIDAEETRAKAAEKQNADDIDVIESKIPAGASDQNQLADKEFVNNSIATATATYRGAYNLVNDLSLTVGATHEQIATALAGAISTADNNDYCFVQIPTADATPTQIASIERYKFNGTAWAYEYTLNNSGFTAAQWAALNSGITSGLVAKLLALPTNEALALTLAGKQDVLTFDSVPVDGSNNPVKSGGVYSAIGDEETRAKAAEKANADDIDDIEALIPATASDENQLADKQYVNDGIATASATYRGSFNEVNDLSLTTDATHEQIATALAGAISTADNNDYCFVQIPTSDAAPTQIASIERYKFNGTAWAYEYTLNNSGFTAAQWAALNSGITSGLVAKLSALPTNDALTLALAGKQDVLTFDNEPTSGSNNPVKSGGVYDAIDAEATTRAAAIAAIVALIPEAASALNQLADKAFVNSSISTATAVFKGTFNVVVDLELSYNATQEQIATMLASKIISADNNDYCFVQIPTSDAAPLQIARTDRYKFNGTAWAYEYTLNNSGFTTAQWAAINSGITSLLKDKLIDLPTATELTALLAAKQNQLTFDTTPTTGSTNPVTSGGIKSAIDAEKARAEAAEADRYTKSETYNKTEINGMVSTPHQNYVTVPTYASLPSSGQSTDTIYRVSSYDGANNQVDDTVYSEYAWDGTQYVFLRVNSQIEEVFDITVYNNNTKYADLSAALGVDGANIPATLRRGGMSVKFVQSSDNKYVQYRLTSNTFTTTISKWQKQGANVVNLNDLLNQSAPFNYRTTAHYNTPDYLRVKGQIITFLVTENGIDKWVTEQFVSDNLDDWNGGSGWIEFNLLSGYLFKGLATANTNPGTPKQKVFYIGIEIGATYAHFNNIKHNDDYLMCILLYDTEWHSYPGLYISSSIADINNPVKAKTIRNALQKISKNAYLSNDNGVGAALKGLYLINPPAGTYTLDYFGYYPSDGGKNTAFILKDGQTYATVYANPTKDIIPIKKDNSIVGYIIMDVDVTQTDVRISGSTINLDVVKVPANSPTIFSYLNNININGFESYTNNNTINPYIKFICASGPFTGTAKIGFWRDTNYINIQLLDGDSLKATLAPTFKNIIDDFVYYEFEGNGYKMQCLLNLYQIYNAYNAGTGIMGNEVNASFRHNIPVKYQLDCVKQEIKDYYVVDKSGNGDFTSLTEAIIYVTKMYDKTLFVKDGVYDLEDEFKDYYGDDFFDNYTGSNPNLWGLNLRRRIHLIFDANAIVKFDYSGDNTAVMTYFSPFNSAEDGFIIENAVIQASRCRYCVHDDRGGMSTPYINEYRNCKMYLDNSQNSVWTSFQCIGGGYGKSGIIRIDNCEFESVDTRVSPTTPGPLVSYHGNSGGLSDCLCRTEVSNCYFKNGTYQTSYYGNSTPICVSRLCGNSFLGNPILKAEAGSTGPINVAIVEWNNEIRTT